MRAFPLVNRTTAATIIACFDLSFGFCSLLIITFGLYFETFGKAFFFYILPSLLILLFGLTLLIAIQKKSQMLTNASLIINSMGISSALIMMVLLIFTEVSFVAYIPLLTIIVLQAHKLWIVLEFRKIVKASSSSFEGKFDFETDIKCQRLAEEEDIEFDEPKPKTSK